MHFLGILRLTQQFQSESAWTEEAYLTRSAHAAYWDYHFGAGVLLHGGRITLSLDDPRAHAVMVLSADSLEDAKELVENDPCVQSGIMEGEVLPYKVIWRT